MVDKRIVFVVVIIAIIAAVVILPAALIDPEADMNDCEAPVAWTKADGDISVTFTVGAPSGGFDRIEVHTADKDYQSQSGVFDRIGQSIAGKAGNIWVTSYATGPDGIVTPQRDSTKTPYEFGLETAYSGSAQGTFRTGDVCVESHGVVTWTFVLKLQNNGEDKIWTLATENRDITV